MAGNREIILDAACYGFVAQLNADCKLQRLAQKLLQAERVRIDVLRSCNSDVSEMPGLELDACDMLLALGVAQYEAKTVGVFS